MAIEIEDKTISISVKDLVALEDNFHGYPDIGAVGFNRAELGRLAHEKYQSREVLSRNFQKEVRIKHRLEIDGYSVYLRGRIDGMLKNENKIIVEEVKTVFMNPGQFKNIDAQDYQEYSNQLKIYCYLLYLQNPGVNIVGQLVFINLLNSTIRRAGVYLDHEKIENYIIARIRNVIQYLELQIERKKKQKVWAEVIQFPFDKKRPFQDKMVADIFQAVNQPKNMLIHAPTGIGKTSAVLYPVLKSSFKTGRKLFFLTAKTTQQDLVLETLKKFERQDIPLVAVGMRAKRKMCLNNTFICHEDFCPYITNFFTKLTRSGIIDELLNRHIIDPDTIFDTAQKHDVCPFELSLELVFHADVVVCDYNYIFDPVVSLQRFFLLNNRKNCVLIIDEAHNLYDRGRGYYSEEISRSELEKLVKKMARKRSRIHRALFNFYREMLKNVIKIQKRLGNGEKSMEIKLNREYFQVKKSELQKLMLRYYIHKKRYELVIPDDPIDNFYNKYHRFCMAISFVGEEFTTIFETREDDQKLRVVCLDPSNELNKLINRFAVVIGMSGTLEPLKWYCDVLGFDTDKTNLARYRSPFPPENRCILAVPTVSTRYRDRENNYKLIAETISEIVACQKGNYIIFFPSFVFLDRVHDLLHANGYNIITQQRMMIEFEREHVLHLLRNGKNNNLILAVQGGIFAEGVDYPGEMVIGAVVVGPGLPQVGLERDLMRKYYDDKYGKGFEYAYLYPGMVRVIQSAGRVIRSENDKGVIVLLGSRFGERQYNSLFPRHWFNDHPGEIVNNDFNRLRTFWQNNVVGC
jgi:DNA excision repair protein ERCC-2